MQTIQRNHKNSSLSERQDRQEPSKGNVIPEWARQKSLANGISNGTSRCDHNEANPLELIVASLTKYVAQIQDDLYEQDGFHDRITCLAQNYDENTSELETLRAENSHLQEEVQLLKSIVINLDRKVTQNQNDIIDLKSISMKHNILVHNLAEEDGENLFIKIPALIIEHLGVDTKFSNIHRNGWGKQDKPRSITGRLINQLP